MTLGRRARGLRPATLVAFLCSAAPAAAYTPPLHCSTPTPAQCVDPNYHGSLCASHFASFCAPYEKTAYEQAYASNQAAATARMPPRSIDDGANPTSVSTKAFDVGWAGADATGSNGSYTSFMHAVRYGAHLPIRTPFRTLVWYDPRTGWSQNGSAVTSCQEYVYEKYYDMSVFEDAMPQHQGDPVGAYQALLASVLRGGVSFSKDRGFFSNIYPVRPTGPKNGFYLLPETEKFESDTSVITYYGVLAQGDAARPPNGTLGDQSYLETPSRAWAFNDVTHTGSTYLAQKGADWYDRLDELIAETRTAVATRNALYERGVDCTNQMMANHGPADDPWCAQYFSMNASGATVSTGIDDELDALDQQIEAFYVEADKRGCLYNDALGVCDFSPRAAMDALLSNMRAVEEAAFEKCVLYTENDFVNGSTPRSFVAHPNPQVTPLSATPTVGQIDTFMRQVDAWIRSLDFPVGPDGDMFVGGASADSTTFGDAHYGVTFAYNTSWAIADYPGTNPTVTGYCDAELTVNAAASAQGRLLSSTPFDLVDAEATVDVADQVRGTGTFRVLGNVIYDAGENESGKFDLALSQHDSQTFAEASIVVPICGVPVTLAAGLAGGVGYDGALTGHVTHRCNGTAESGFDIGVDGTFTPYVDLDAFASASIDLGFAAIGVKGDLTLLKVGLPLGVHAGIQVDPALAQGGGDGSTTLALTTTATLDLDMRALDGRIAAFIDYPLGSSEATLVKWNGIHKTHNLFTSNLTKLPLSIGAVVATEGAGALPPGGLQ